MGDWRSSCRGRTSWGDRPQRLEIRVSVRLVEDQPDLLHAGVEEALHLIAALLRRAEDGHGVDHLIGDQRRRSVALARLERLAHAVGLGAEADTAHVLVI